MEVSRWWRKSKGLEEKSNSVKLYGNWKASFEWVEPVDNAEVDPAEEIRKAREAWAARESIVAQAVMLELVG